MSYHSRIEGAVSDSDAVATRDKVVIIVTPRAEPSEDAAGGEVAAEPSRAAEAPSLEAPDAAGDGAGAAPAPEAAEAAPPRERGPEDDELLGAVIMVDLGADPSPLTDFLGRSLLYRAARVASDVGAPRLILIGHIPPDQRDRVYDEAYRGFREGVVELSADDITERSLGRGRVLFLDGTALHDVEAVRRLVRVRGDKTALLLGQNGDGFKVALHEGKVVEIGGDVSPFDGIMVGAASIPVEDFERITRVGQRAALRALGEEGRLIGIVATETFGRQFRDEERIERAEVECFDALAASGTEGLFEDLIGRPFARLVTLKLLRTRISAGTVSVVAGVLALLAAGLLALGHAGLALLGSVLAIASAVLDRSDGELARLRLEDDEGRMLDFGLDHLTHALIFLGLAVGVSNPASGVGGWPETLARLPGPLRTWLEAHQVSAMTVGLVAAGGVLLLLAVSLWRGEPSPRSRGLRRLGDLVATSFGSRDAFYVLFGFAVFNAFPGMAEMGVLGFFLLLAAALVHLAWCALFLVSIPAPRPPAPAQ